MTTQQTDIEKTLKRILARELPKWPELTDDLQQCSDGEVVGYGITLGFMELASDFQDAVVTRADWEAERALLASEQAQPLVDSEEFDQALWDKVAISAVGGVVASRGFHEFSTFQGVPSNAAIFGADVADAFMVERAKRIAARKSIND